MKFLPYYLKIYQVLRQHYSLIHMLLSNKQLNKYLVIYLTYFQEIHS